MRCTCELAASLQALKVITPTAATKAMTDGLFGASAPQEAEATLAAGARRAKLYPWDSVAAQVLEPHGSSSFDSMSLQQVWQAASRGNKKAAYHSHLCASQSEDGWHVGAGLSITAATLLSAAEHFRSNEMKALIKEELYAKVEDELRTLVPVLQILNLGKGSQQGSKDTSSFKDAKKRKLTPTIATGPTASPEQMNKAAADFHAWLSQDRSAFRSLLLILSGSNTYFTGHVAETVARAAVAHKPMTSADFQVAMKTRMSSIPPPSESSGQGASDASGLLQL